jgi:hypothetical protein
MSGIDHVVNGRGLWNAFGVRDVYRLISRGAPLRVDPWLLGRTASRYQMGTAAMR